MFIETKRDRHYFVCDKCGKPYSFKRDNCPTNIMMMADCREHGKRFYPPLPKKNWLPEEKLQGEEAHNKVFSFPQNLHRLLRRRC